MSSLRNAAEMALEFIVLVATKDKPWFTEKEFEVVAALRQALNVDAVNMTQERVDETAKREHEPVGYLSVRYFLGDKAMTNTDFEYFGDLPEGDYTVYTTPPPCAQETRVFDRGCWERGCIAYDDRDGDGVVVQANIKEKNT